ncbi:type IV pili methyl-accepting chemotaxis transducer N-terminal domain-containing protein [Marinoscillum sp. MHG1-6]|uniref:type IV pili methyl-accepting chemotaxis transducer N-terminal domain-containing protein n=1 Tax=Marinoscillum sp. MHG1-6 TaxID=2959627 RepID=UPI0021581D3B|nr:type IV pili methyl-accepting chemotaxis transducer N-terminal domain-containing protein [Marinoscillum sp. MHG1-6]
MKNLTRTYLVALAIIALVIGLSQFLVQNSISTGSSDSRTINISGRQRMLSQKLTKASLAMQAATTDEEFNKRKTELQKAYDLWTSSHHALQYGSAEMKMEEVNNSPTILSLFEEIEPHYQIMKAAVETVLSTETFSDTRTDVFNASLSDILANEGTFLKLMNDITFEYDAESTGRIESLSVTEYILFGVAIFLLLMEGIFIFRPAMKKIQEYTRELISQGDSLKQSLAKEEYLNNQASSIFENVKQGVFLLDQNLMISDFYSKETDRIFSTEDLSNTNFLKLMRPRLVKRDLAALEMFVEHLFNKDIRETVVNRLNPVEQVEIFPEKGTADSMDPRYIRISFARIMNEGEIHRILVTVLDETETTLMRKQIEEAEEKNKEESTQLLAILKVDPTELKNFLDRATFSLSRISKEYEIRKSDNFEELIDFTFNTIHAVKGNATLINMDIIAKRLHLVEDSITDLKRQATIEGKDFLKIVYQVSEIIGILNNMKDMQSKIANVYEQVNQGFINSENPVEQFKLTLETGLEKMSAEKQKKVKLDFKNNGVNLPEEHLLSFKDIAVQLMRNSLAHGIESPELRKEMGKPETATIKMVLGQNEDGVIFNYHDDGQGLNIKKIISNAIKNKLIDKDEISKLTTQDITNIIFRNDFSTTGNADQYSGRGQGMGLIKSIVNKHNGSFKLGFKKGQSFKMQIVLPVENVLETLSKTA